MDCLIELQTYKSFYNTKGPDKISLSRPDALGSCFRSCGVVEVHLDPCTTLIGVFVFSDLDFALPTLAEVHAKMFAVNTFIPM